MDKAFGNANSIGGLKRGKFIDCIPREGDIYSFFLGVQKRPFLRDARVEPRTNFTSD